MAAATAPLGALIASVGRSVADAQKTIDVCTLAQFASVYDRSVEAFEPLRAIGYQPTWYQIAEATAEIALALRVTPALPDTSATAESSLPRRRGLAAAPVDAAYRSRFDFRQQSASAVKFRVVPVPEPPQARLISVAAMPADVVNG